MKIQEKRNLGISERFASKIFGTSGLNGHLVEDEPRFKNEGNAQNYRILNLVNSSNSKRS